MVSFRNSSSLKVEVVWFDLNLFREAKMRPCNIKSGLASLLLRERSHNLDEILFSALWACLLRSLHIEKVMVNAICQLLVLRR